MLPGIDIVPPNLRMASGSAGPRQWTVPTPAGTEPGAISLEAVTRDVTGLEDPAVAAYFERIMNELNTDQRPSFFEARQRVR